MKKLYYNLKSSILKQNTQPLVPRKKIEIKISKVNNMLQEKVKQLQNLINKNSDNEFIVTTGNIILSDISNFYGLYSNINDPADRLLINKQFIDPNDLLMWQIFQLKRYISEIDRFLINIGETYDK